jgi:hypothetical protein
VTVNDDGTEALDTVLAAPAVLQVSFTVTWLVNMSPATTLYKATKLVFPTKVAA